MCFVDFKKAFDCVDHEKMWCEIESCMQIRKRQSEQSLYRPDSLNRLR